MATISRDGKTIYDIQRVSVTKVTDTSLHIIADDFPRRFTVHKSSSIFEFFKVDDEKEVEAIVKARRNVYPHLTRALELRTVWLEEGTSAYCRGDASIPEIIGWVGAEYLVNEILFEEFVQIAQGHRIRIKDSISGVLDNLTGKLIMDESVPFIEPENNDDIDLLVLLASDAIEVL